MSSPFRNDEDARAIAIMASTTYEAERKFPLPRETFEYHLNLAYQRLKQAKQYVEHMNEVGELHPDDPSL